MIPGCSDNYVNNYQIYYINAESGNDSNSGISPNKAWKTLSMINKLHLDAGQQILLKSGQTYYGTIKIQSAIGTSDSPVIISSYGKGRATIISGDSLAFIASNCDHLIFKNIDAKGSGRLKGNKTNGVEFFKVRNGIIDSVEVTGYLRNGVQVSGGENIRITNVYAFNNGSCGINVNSAGRISNDPDSLKFRTPKNIYLGHCIAENNPGCPAIKNNHSGNGILLGGIVKGLVEYCEAMDNGWDMPRDGNGPVGIWAYSCDSLIIQYCYSHNNKTSLTGKDGGGFDFDGGMTNSILQYNLSAFNEGAGYGIFQYRTAKEWSNNIARYNISYNDGSKNSHAGIYMWCDPQAIPMKNFHAYNNTVVTNQGLGLFFEPGEYKDFVFENNIFYVTIVNKHFIDGRFTLASFKRNVYWSAANSKQGLPQPISILDKDALTEDPQLEMPLSEYILNFDINDFSSFPYFKLKEGSVCHNNGNIISCNGGKDFWGNTVSSDTKPDIGAEQN